MGSYFVRHTDVLQVRREDLEALWQENKIAVHYPGDTSRSREDNDSTDPDNYKGSERTGMRCLRELADKGGYLWAQTYVSDEVKVGYVKGRSEGGKGIEPYREARWHVTDTYPGRKTGASAILKTVRMEPDTVQPLSPGQAMGLRAGRPRQGTIVRWHKCGTRLEDLVEGNPPKQDWDNLSPQQQEAACAEFLKYRHQRADLPVLEHLLLPVGRTLEDVDIYGLSEEGRKVFAQVTYLDEDSPEAPGKVATLKRYDRDGAYLVFFCQGERGDHKQGISFVSVGNEVMPWIRNDDDYRQGLFSVE